MSRILDVRLYALLCCAGTIGWTGCVEGDHTSEDTTATEQQDIASSTPRDTDVLQISPKEASSKIGDEETMARYCCKITWTEEYEPFLCIGYNTTRAWATTKCYATVGGIPGSYGVLVSGTCGDTGVCP
jgi:hypothetical protein